MLFIPDPDPEFLPIPDPGGQKGTGSWTRNTKKVKKRTSNTPRDEILKFFLFCGSFLDPDLDSESGSGSKH